MSSARSRLDVSMNSRTAGGHGSGGGYTCIPGYYAFFFYDPDGIKLEVVHVPRAPADGGRAAERGR
jgi:hypothetical protein